MNDAGIQICTKQCPELCPSTAHFLFYMHRNRVHKGLCLLLIWFSQSHFPAFDTVRSTLLSVLFVFTYKKKKKHRLGNKDVNTASVSGRQPRRNRVELSEGAAAPWFQPVEAVQECGSQLGLPDLPICQEMLEIQICI